ncbi:hypothetical protein A2609_02930 [Candidatus Kaiserbacteria bacterium RIFOXYD1_FULL_47_14]|uniref:Uncharacterized protein n=1 Tax=Candidatus Kaiserbacteria bacterium RIFOXYD1_FULL_47_14 TaxID=1798533 RepID=A0A1F6G801_9BACT|nr:MAG: hypothetical protein A2609_02930 [Candidatus Kaiserbacteria bacterium RIFOXYD1_FULL_47_14]
MITLISFLISCQAFGAVVGVGTAVWGELAYIRAMRDGKLDTAERAHLHIIAKGLRFGMTLLLLASLGLVIVEYLLKGAVQPALTASYWVFMTLSLLIIGISWALSQRHISFLLGSAITFTAWWFLAYLTFGLLPVHSFGSALATFVVLTAIIYAMLHYVRLLALHKR